MPVDIRDLLDAAASDRAPRPDYDELWSRGRRRARLRTGAAALGALAVLGVAGAVVADGLTDRTPRIVDQPDGGDSSAPVEHEVDLEEVFAATTDPATFGRVAVFTRGSGTMAVGRDEQGDGPSAVSAFGSCASREAACAFGLVDAPNDRVLVLGTDGTTRSLDPKALDLEAYGYRAPGSLLVRQVRGSTIAFVTVARDLAGSGISRLLAIDVETGDLLADVEHPSPVTNPTIELGRAPEDGLTGARQVWVQVSAERTYVPVLLEAPGRDSHAVGFEPVTDGASVPMPIGSETGVAVDVDTTGQRARVTVTAPGRHQVWDFPATLIDAVHPTHDGLLVVARPWGEREVRHLLRVVGDQVREHRLVPHDAVGGSFFPDGTLLTVVDTADGGVEVLAQRPSSYAGTNPSRSAERGEARS